MSATKVCFICKKEKSIVEFYQVKHVRGTGISPYCRPCTATKRREYGRILYDTLKSEKSCAICGYNRCKSALHFHHVDESEKQFQIGKILICASKHSAERLVRELEKCVLLCGNCHAEVHEGLSAVDKIPRYIPDPSILEAPKQALKPLRNKRILERAVAVRDYTDRSRGWIQRLSDSLGVSRAEIVRLSKWTPEQFARERF